MDAIDEILRDIDALRERLKTEEPDRPPPMELLTVSEFDALKSYAEGRNINGGMEDLLQFKAPNAYGEAWAARQKALRCPTKER